MKTGIINHNQCCMKNVWLTGPNYITSSIYVGWNFNSGNTAVETPRNGTK